MSFSGAEIMTWLASIFWPFVRVSAMLTAAPIFSARSIPARIRIILAVVITMVLVPVIPDPPVVDLISLEAALIAAYQVLIGVAMGFIFQMIFGAFVIAGQSVAMAMGLGFASIIDPQNGVQVPVVSQAFLIMVTLVFLALNGHLLLIDMIATSFTKLPVGLILPSRDGLWQLVNWGSSMFAGGMLVALPAVAALLLVNLAFGVVSRATPQLNIFAVGFPVMILMGLIFMIITMPGITDHLSHLMTQGFNLVSRVI